MNINKDEPTGDNEADAIVKKAKAQATRIVQTANLKAKQIIAAAQEQAGEKAPQQEAARRWVYNRKTSESKIIPASQKTPAGWHTSPK